MLVSMRLSAVQAQLVKPFGFPFLGMKKLIRSQRAIWPNDPLASAFRQMFAELPTNMEVHTPL